MGRYRARDLVNAPTLVSLLRFPLAALFPFVHESAPTSLVVLAAAGLTDVIDGAIARRFGLATPTGAVVDGVSDKVFAFTVLATLVAKGVLSPLDVVLLGTREIGELPLVVWLAVSPEARRRKVDDRANLLGKAATVLQFGAIALAIMSSRFVSALVVATVVVGAAAAASYWRRALLARQRERIGAP